MPNKGPVNRETSEIRHPDPQNSARSARTLPSVLEEGYLIEEGVWQKFKNVTRGGSDKPKMLQEGGP